MSYFFSVYPAFTPMSGNETTPAAPASAPSMVVVNGQSMYLNAEKKLNVPGTFGPNVFLMDSAGTVIPCDSNGTTEFKLQEGATYTTKVKNVFSISSAAATMAANAAKAPKVAAQQQPKITVPVVPKPQGFTGGPRPYAGATPAMAAQSQANAIGSFKARTASASVLQGQRVHPYARPGGFTAPAAAPSAIALAAARRSSMSFQPMAMSGAAPAYPRMPPLQALQVARGPHTLGARGAFGASQVPRIPLPLHVARVLNAVQASANSRAGAGYPANVPRVQPPPGIRPNLNPMILRNAALRGLAAARSPRG